ncbi:MAG: ABC transporter ATP-binding protein [Eubacteriales bacterium]|nr:ABC transporter ATP-binding protein [Christensenellaceae bacterium]MDY2751466.1 ABC transporter ATP-binding protein [Eubacteriales bacterium]
MEQANAIELRNITKRFGEVVANKNVSLDVKRGEILSLLGENGSGKTTLMNMIAGIYFPDEGEIFVDGKEVVIRSPRDAYNYHIGMIHQHFKLVDVFTAADNVMLGEKAPRFGIREKAEKYKEELEEGKIVVDADNESAPVRKVSDSEKPSAKFRYAMKCAALPFIKAGKKIAFNTITRNRADKIQAIADKYGFEIDVKKKIYDMSVSEKQTVEIIKALYRGAEILILDEPTAVLTPQETKKLFDVLRNMREDGKAIIIITHKLNEVLEISDRVAVLRKGEYIGTVETRDANENSLTEMMVGEKIELNIERTVPENVEERLKIDAVSCRNREGVLALDNVSFKANSGEILGIAGIAGSGQRELLEAIAGLQRLENGDVVYYDPKDDNREIDLRQKTPTQIRDLGVRLSFVPEDRLGMGLVGNMDLTDNMMLRSYGKGHSMFLDRKTPHDLAENIVNELEVVTPSIRTPVRKLSGGNVQKVLVGREIASAPTVLMAAYPVRGLDINSSYTIYNLLNKQKENGVAVIFVGEDLDVLLALSDRIMVLCGGKVSGIVDARRTTKEQLGLLMTRMPEKVEIFDDIIKEEEQNA